jgi:hypothetical protein
MRFIVMILALAAACGREPACARPDEAGGQWVYPGGVLSVVESRGGALVGSDTRAHYVSGYVDDRQVQLVSRDGAWTLSAAIDGCVMSGVLNVDTPFEASKQQ